MSVQKELSICIPTYNGSSSVFLLLSTLLNSPCENFEIVVSDDCSNDDTWLRIQEMASNDTRLRCFRNQANLGMDKNFARSVELARGRYVWLCGQDDMIFTSGLDSVLIFLSENRNVDFIYFNHSKRVEYANGSRVIPAAMQIEHVLGKGLAEFLSHTGSNLPTFLPTYLIRTSIWRSVDISHYFGTCYSQVGVFLEASNGLRWCHFSGDFVVGLIPKNGWQSNPKDYVRIAFGYFVMIERAIKKVNSFDLDMLHKHHQLQRRRLIYSFILCRYHRLAIDSEFLGVVLSAIRPFNDIAWPIALVKRMPDVTISALYHLINWKRWLRERFRIWAG